jgi:hypothetical protein
MNGPVKVASFNVNGIRARLPLLVTWLEREARGLFARQLTRFLPFLIMYCGILPPKPIIQEGRTQPWVAERDIEEHDGL